MQSAKETFDRDGFAVLPGFLSHQDMEELTRQLARYMAEVLPKVSAGSLFFEIKGRPDTLRQFPIRSEENAYFEQLYTGGRLRQLAELLLDGPVIPKSFQWLNKPARFGKETPPHQDGFYHMLDPNEAVSIWLALDAMDQENGCMRWVRGSHRRGLRTHGRIPSLGFAQGIADFNTDDQEQEVATIVKPGDLLICHSLTIQRADANSSARNRRTLQFVYFSARAREDAKRKEEYRKRLCEEIAQGSRR
ncbi:MAG: phytanoyl-CoA dioxygenase family protein [Verrucomicrobia bacterium]|nr:phytanoyl-CoA dioxygenase family protein [Verrucomicrobiota bacterium]